LSSKNNTKSDELNFLTIDDFDTKGKTVFLRVDINSPINPQTHEINGTIRIEEAIGSIKYLANAKIVMASHQGRVGNKDFTEMEKHAKMLEKILGRKVKYVDDVMGTHAQNEIKSLHDGEILLLNNLRLCAEENYEFAPEDAAKTIMVKKLSRLFDLCVLDSFPNAHRSHPSIVGFPQVLPTCAGRIVEKELPKLDKILSGARGPRVIILGGSKVSARLEAVRVLLKNNNADQILLTGVIGHVFLRAQGRIRFPLGINKEEELVSKAHSLIGEYPDVFFTPVDVAIDRDGSRIEMDVVDVLEDDQILDIGLKTVDYYLKSISNAGTVFLNGPAGFFEKDNFNFGTLGLLTGAASSSATTIVSGGHLTSALKKYGLEEKIDYINSAGGALVLYMSGIKLPMILALEEAAKRYRSK